MIWTVGHGSRSTEELLALLAEARIDRVADVRPYPASRRHPRFAREALEGALSAAGIEYRWAGQSLGGRRKPASASPHTALRSAGMRAYADHMMSPAFRSGAADLIETGRARRVAILCAERLPWQCHRCLIADHLVAAGAPVVHLVGPGVHEPHRLSPLARLRDGQLVYDGATQGELRL